MSLYEMRRNYTLKTLQETDVDPDPMVQFDSWLKEANVSDLPDWVETNAMTLATSDLSGNVTSRIVLLKGLDDGKFWFYTNYRSAKASQIESNPRVSLCFLWQHVQRQVRIEGTISKAPREQSERYFHMRPRDSQFGALVSDQSEVIASRDVLEQKLSELHQTYGTGEIPCPESWGGYAVDPQSIEFWQGRQQRLHDRLQYSRTDSGWKLQRLAP